MAGILTDVHYFLLVTPQLAMPVFLFYSQLKFYKQVFFISPRIIAGLEVLAAAAYEKFSLNHVAEIFISQ